MVVRVGVIGAGIMGADHARTLHRWVSGAEVAVVADIAVERAETVSSEIPGATATADARAVIADPAVDAVVIASDDSTHAGFTIAAVGAGKPVLCEKPLAPTLAECVRVVEAAAGHEHLVSVGFMRRFDPGYTELRSAIEARTVGPPVLLRCASRGIASGPGTTSESSMTNSAVHEFDIVAWLLRCPVIEVSWHAPRASSQVTGFQDPQLMLLRTADGVLSTVELFLNARYGYDVRCEVVGESGAISLAEPVRLVTDADRRRGTGYAADWRPRHADAYRLQLQAWIDGIVRGGLSAMATVHDGLRASAVAEAVIASMHDGGRTTRVPG